MLGTGKHPGTPVKSKSPKKPSKGAVEDTKMFRFHFFRMMSKLTRTVRTKKGTNVFIANEKRSW